MRGECDHVWRMRDGIGVNGYHHVCEKCGETFAVTLVSSTTVNLNPRATTVVADDAEVALSFGTAEDRSDAPPSGKVRPDA